jgi:hypothetical protein
VREVVAGIHPVCIHGAQILNLKLDQGAGKFGGVTKVLRKFIGFEFVFSAEDVHQELDNSVHWGKSIGKEDEADDNWKFVVETEGLVEGSVVDKYGEERENVEEMRLCVVSLPRFCSNLMNLLGRFQIAW